MESFKLVFKPSVEKDFKKIPKEIAPGIFQALSDLAGNPLPRKCVKLSGAQRLYRIRVRDYRIVYEVDSDARKIIIHYIRHRREVYRTR